MENNPKCQCSGKECGKFLNQLPYFSMLVWFGYLQKINDHCSGGIRELQENSKKIKHLPALKNFLEMLQQESKQKEIHPIYLEILEAGGYLNPDKLTGDILVLERGIKRHWFFFKKADFDEMEKKYFIGLFNGISLKIRRKINELSEKIKQFS